MAVNQGYSQTGPRGPDYYQLKPQPEPKVKTAEPKETLPRFPKYKPQNGTYEVTMSDGKNMKPGGGGRFQALKDKLAKEKGVDDPGALAASIGMRKYGRAKFQAFAAKARKK